jgi:hypothetical protein
MKGYGRFNAQQSIKSSFFFSFLPYALGVDLV